MAEGTGIMRVIFMLLIVAVAVMIGAVSLGYIDIRQTRTAALPSVEVKGGQAPVYDVRTANVTVGEANRVVSVPTVNVQKPH
jgi:hypothetical protein